MQRIFFYGLGPSFTSPMELYGTKYWKDRTVVFLGSFCEVPCQFGEEDSFFFVV